MPDPVPAGALHFAVAGPIVQRTGGYIYDRRIVEELRGQSMEVALYELPGRHPLPDAAALAAATGMLDGLPDDGGRSARDGGSGAPDRHRPAGLRICAKSA